MKNLNFLLFILILGLKLSCGEGTGEVTRLEFNMASEATSEKVSLFGHSENGEYFSRNLNTNDSIRIEIPNGIWQFYTLIWKDNFGGDIKCGVSSKKYLNGISLNIDLAANENNCLSSEFLGELDSFPKIKVEGTDNSYKLKLTSSDYFNGVFIKKDYVSYESECLSSSAEYDFKIPLLFASLPFHYEIEEFEEASCDNLIKKEVIGHLSERFEYDSENHIIKIKNF